MLYNITTLTKRSSLLILLIDKKQKKEKEYGEWRQYCLEMKKMKPFENDEIMRNKEIKKKIKGNEEKKREINQLMRTF